jgi:hypothetical protein
MSTPQPSGIAAPPSQHLDVHAISQLGSVCFDLPGS